MPSVTEIEVEAVEVVNLPPPAESGPPPDWRRPSQATRCHKQHPAKLLLRRLIWLCLGSLLALAVCGLAAVAAILAISFVLVLAIRAIFRRVAGH